MAANFSHSLKICLENRDWGLGIGDWGLGIGDWGFHILHLYG
ncbi:MAG: hypothetical protein ACFKPT_16400 [Gloeotrichia echinulata GP01]